MSWSESNQVYIKRFHKSSTSWVFVSYTHCCTTLKTSKFKAHDDPGLLRWSYDHLMQFSLVISHCNITFSVFWFSQGSAATQTRWGGWSSYCHVCHSFVNLTVKTSLKCIDIDFWWSYTENYVGCLFMGHRVVCLLSSCDSVKSTSPPS